ncbi:ATP-binding cassette domain-containing protein [bacterium]|nr:ATP-binding cassette domain-containing protein [bacterium]MCI0606340.1 ATP-binding cassette domain-containing protein [bacterium]
MELILVKSPETPEEQIFHLKIGSNTLGSSRGSDLTVSESGILPHHLSIEYTKDSLILSAIEPGTSFYYQGRSCRNAVVKPGEVFSIENITFHCTAISGSDPTQHAMLLRPLAAAPASVTSAPVPRLQEMQISAFVQQQPVTFPMVIGRNARSDLILDHPTVSAFHARIQREGGSVYIEDLQSSNGTYVSDVPIRKAYLQPGDSVVIMPYFLIYTGEFLNVYTFQRESRLIGWQINMTAGEKRILDRVTISCASNELIGLIGPSGSGKTTLLKCLSGQTYPLGGRVQLNGLEVFSHFPLFKRNIGYVPQDDIVHRDLSVHETLMYAAKLRLPADMSEKERKARVWETLIELELEEQERQTIHQLSGGQRKRVNIAIELLTKPGLLFLDEPTSGLDPSLDERLMILFKRLSQDGRITIMTTHLLEHADMFSKIAMMHYGRLIFFGSPEQARSFFRIRSIGSLYSKIKERPAEDWQNEFHATALHQQEVSQLRDQVLPSKRKEASSPGTIQESAHERISQWGTLSRRYLNIILRDKKNTGILLLQAPLIAFFIVIATSNLSHRLFMMTLAALWFGCNNSAREICKELPLYRRERMVYLSIVPYLCSKFFVLSILVFVQCLVLASLVPTDFLRAYWPLLLCGIAGIAMGLLVSTVVNSPDKAIAMVPILLIPQVLFSGVFGELVGIQKPIGELMISKWSYNLMKKEFELPSYTYRNRLEKQIDDGQARMKEIQDDMVHYQNELKATLRDMEDKYYPSELQDLQTRANRTLQKLRKEQDRMEASRLKVEHTEKELRAKAKHFVWIDRPDSPRVDWIVLCIFTISLLVLSYAQLHRKDKQLLAL